MHLERIDTVHVLHLGDEENRYNAESVARLTELVAQVEAVEGPRALVMVADGKFWSNGLDLEWLDANRDEAQQLIADLQELYAKILGASFVTIAAIQGHCYAGGAIMAMAFDVRIMRHDRGFFCFPEADIGIPFSPGMSALLSAKLTPQVAQQALVFARRYSGPDAAAAGIVDETAGEAELLPRAIAYAAELADKNQGTMQTIKQRLYGSALAALRDPYSSPIDGLFDR